MNWWSYTKLQTANVAETTDETAAQELSTLTFSVGGMTCAACVHHVGNALRALPGVVDATVSIGTEIASVEFTPTSGTVTKLALDGSVLGTFEIGARPTGGGLRWRGHLGGQCR